MNKLFAALLFFCVVGASVLWWLMKTLPDNGDHPKPPEAHSVEHADTPKVAEAHEDAPAELVLRIDTIPQGAKVEVAGIYEGVTPLDVKLRKEAAEALIALEGFEVYRHAVPTVDQAEGAELSWKVTLKEKPAHAAPVKEKELTNGWLHGSKGSYFVQLKAAEESIGKSAIEDQIHTYRATLGNKKISGCLVNLGAKGKWYRILAGPFSTRKEADAKRLQWLSRKSAAVEGFVTGRQSCI